MTKEKKNELVKKLKAYAMDDKSKMDDVLIEIAQTIVDEITAMLNPLNTLLVPFYITVFELTAANLRAQYPAEAEIANDLKRVLTSTAIAIRNIGK